MDEFKESTWGNAEKDRHYREDADFYLPERQRMLKILVSFYRHFIGKKKTCRILDLGCGNGILARTLYTAHPGVELVLVDGSEHMLEAAHLNLAGLPVADYQCLTFREIIDGKLQTAPFDFIVSSFAIHHLYLGGKRELFAELYRMLLPGGCFLNMDVVLPAGDFYTEWHYSLWKEWIDEFRQKNKLVRDFTGVPEQARTNPENHYDRLFSQLEALTAAGFTRVECHYRFGLFALYGGMREE